MTIEARRAVFEAARAKALGLGLKFEDDPDFLASVEQWAKSEIDMGELRLRYMNLLYQRQDSKWLGLPLNSISNPAVGDVDLAEHTAEFLGDRLALFFLKVEDGDLHALGGELPRGRGAKAGRAAGDDGGNAVVELH